jgi:hypothetical protein
MAYNNGPKIVTNGLVLCLDAANQKSYPGSGTTWFDLSGNNRNATLNGPVFVNENGGVIECIDVSNNGSRIEFGSLNLNTPSVSIEYWFKLTSNPNVSGDNEFRFMCFKTNNFFNYMEQGRTINFTVHKGGTQFRRIDSTFAHGQPNNSAFDIGTWYHVLFSHNESNGHGSYFYNGELVRTGIMSIQSSPFTEITTGPIDSTNTSLIFSQNHSSGVRRFFPGYLASLKIYNRPLTQSEVKQNYNAGKSRFVL